jgi:hypothetical protein
LLSAVDAFSSGLARRRASCSASWPLKLVGLVGRLELGADGAHERVLGLALLLVGLDGLLRGLPRSGGALPAGRRVEPRRRPLRLELDVALGPFAALHDGPP